MESEAVKHHICPYLIAEWPINKKCLTKFYLEVQVSKKNVNWILPLPKLVPIYDVHFHY